MFTIDMFTFDPKTFSLTGEASTLNDEFGPLVEITSPTTGTKVLFRHIHTNYNAEDELTNWTYELVSVQYGLNARPVAVNRLVIFND